MAFDGTLKFDTSIDKSGFESGLAKLGSIAKAGMAAVEGYASVAADAVSSIGEKASDIDSIADAAIEASSVIAALGKNAIFVDTVADSAEEAALTISEIGKNAISVDAVTDSAEEAALTISEIGKNAAAIDDVSAAAEGASESVTELGDKSADVDEVTGAATDASDAMAELEGKSRSAGVSISSAFEKIGGIAKTGMKAIAGAITAATGAMAALGAKALEAYADYEQLTGGVATLFGAQDMSLEEYAQSVGKTADAVKGEYDNLIAAQDAVMQNAAEAYRTAGMSANKYMDTVTSFSAALIASLDGDTAKAAQVADRAIVDMSDNANKMGSSMESIQTAYQGFAKQNYTMLDNLKLGYGGTKSEMERLLADAEKLSGIHYNLDSYADIVEAIHVIQTEMGITGTTAREAAETISGSVAMTKAAFSNLLVGIADDEQDFEKLVDDLVSSATTAAGNILPRVETIIGGIGKLISSMSGVAADMLVDLTAYVPDLIAAGVSLIGAVADGLTANAPAVSQAALDAGLLLVDGIMSVTPNLLALTGELISTLIDGLTEHLPVLADAAMETGLSILSGITAHLPDIIEAAKNIITKITDVLVTNIPLVANAAVQIVGSLLETLTDPSLLTSLLNAALQIILTLAQALLDNIPQIIEIISTLITNVIDFIIEAVPMLLDAAVQLFMSIVDALPQIIEALTKELPRILDAVVSVIPQLVQALAKALPQIIQAITQAIPIIIQAITQNLPQIINALISSLLSMNTQLLDAAIQLLYAILDALPIINEALLEALPEIIDAIVTVLIEAVPQMYEAAFTLFMALVEALPEVLEKLVEYFKEFLDSTIEKVQTWAADLAKKGKEGAADLVKKIETEISTLPQKMFDAGRNLVEGLWNGISNMGNWLKEKISSFAGGIISGFKDAFGIESPSKVMRDSVGKYLAQGIGVGFTEEIPEIGKAALDAFSDLKLPDIDMNVRSDIPKPRMPHIDGDAVNLIRTFNDRPDSGLIQPSPTSEITNNYYSSSTSNRTVSEKPVVNVYNNMNVEMDGEKVAELVAEKVDILQGETVEMDERGTAH